MTPVLKALPADPSPDSGPRHRGDALVLFAAVLAALAALTAVGFGLQAGRPAPFLAAAALTAAAAGWWGWCVQVAIRDHDRSPRRSHALLTGALGFDVICTCHGVAPAVFFHPDRTPPGGELQLLVFLENQSSRQRVVELRAGPHPALGLERATSVRLHLAAGQAAAYRWSLRVSAAAAAGEHDLPLMLRATKPAGTGERLAGSRHHLHDLWRVRFAVPFTVDRGAPAAPRCESQAYVSLASASEAEPRPDALAELLPAPRA